MPTLTGGAGERAHAMCARAVRQVRGRAAALRHAMCQLVSLTKKHPGAQRPCTAHPATA